MIRFEEVTRRYESGGRPALDDVTVEFYRGDFAFLIGASGSGKSTLLRMILREGLPQRGKVTVAGQNLGLMLDRRVPDFRRSIGMVFQDFRLLPDKTVFDNVAFAMRVLGTKRSAIRKRVTKVLEKVDLAHLAKRYPHEISGGEQQRAAIARAIVNGPAILLADEPTGNLDPRASAEVMKVLRWINASGTTVIMATHDRAIVDQAHSRVVQLHRGRLVRDEPHGFYDAPEGSEAWDVLAQEEGESGLRAHDPAPLKTGVVPMIGRDPADGSTTEEPFSSDTDQPADLPEGPAEQSSVPGEDPSVLAFENDPVLQETTPQDYAEELEGMELTPEEFDAQLADSHDFPTDEQPAFQDEEHPAEYDAEYTSHQDDDHLAAVDDEHLADPEDAEHVETEDTVGDDEHDDDVADDEHDHHTVEHTVTDGAFIREDEPEDDESEIDDDGEFEDREHAEETGLHVTWPEHLRQEALGYDVPEIHGDFNGTELPDLEQDGYAEEDFEVEEPLPQDYVTQERVLAEPIAEEPPTGEIAPIPAPRRRLPPMYPTLPPPAQRPASQQAPQEPLPQQEPAPQHPAPRSAAQPDVAGHPTGSPEQDAATRSRLSWLAHVEEDATESTPPAQEATVPRPLPRPQSSAAQSTYTDARRTAEHLGISRSRRSILRRLRRDV
ncbi:cell division ATP-binding protein FtsE [Nesterenkonia halotolerans]|uniref:Cell division ATP-binding protein FtsE n=1 Tax=Nesterenkonia halotolerans TaxID=225325 RepID=A0ABR9J4U4_9MICC|nr:cell division ATP-binding protein FtsE [Nesterenkonia halotolerans]MBE1514010.1 cell division ATP-binding protein FtsE [Nesterenkonia halotolerans]